MGKSVKKLKKYILTGCVFVTWNFFASFFFTAGASTFGVLRGTIIPTAQITEDKALIANLDFYQGIITSLGQTPEFEQTFGRALVGASSIDGLEIKGRVIILNEHKAAAALADSQAADYILISNCSMEGTNISVCELSLYDRRRNRIIVRISKKFRIPIIDASPWAELMLQSLDRGLENRKIFHERKRLDSFMLESQKEDTIDPNSLGLRFGIFKEKIIFDDYGSSSLLAMSLGITKAYDFYLFGGELDWANTPEGKRVNLRIFRQSFRLFLENKELKYGSVDLRLGLHFGYNKYHLELDKVFDINTQNLHIGMAFSVCKRLRQNYEIGLVLKVDKSLAPNYDKTSVGPDAVNYEKSFGGFFGYYLD